MKIVSIADLKQVARKKIPSDMWDFIEGAAFDEITKQRNEDKFREITLNPNFLIDVGTRSLSTTVLGDKIDLPIMIAPEGAKRQLHPDGELAAAKGAGLSGNSIRPPHRVWLQHRGGRRSSNRPRSGFSFIIQMTKSLNILLITLRNLATQPFVSQ